MIVTITPTRRITLEEIRDFLAGSLSLDFQPASREEAYKYIGSTLVRLDYWGLRRPEKGLVRGFLMKVTGYSRTQLTRLVRRQRDTGRIRSRRQDRPRNAFKRRFTREDEILLAETDNLHGLSAGATQRLCRRLYLQGDERYERLATISRSHLYNLRQRTFYRRRRRRFAKTRPVSVPIGVRRKPRPDNRPGFLRADMVHQGDQDGAKGMYLLNVVDEVTQMQYVICVPRITERYMVPAIKRALDRFPFVVRGFHADNGSEFINRRVAALLRERNIELTKSRPRHSNDNGLVESKNGSTVRKVFGHWHIPGEWARAANSLMTEPLFRYHNFHRPCYFPVRIIDDRGKARVTYPDERIMTPFEKLKSLPDAEKHLKPGVTFEELNAIESECDDNDAVRRVNAARAELFKLIDWGSGPASGTVPPPSSAAGPSPTSAARSTSASAAGSTSASAARPSPASAARPSRGSAAGPSPASAARPSRGSATGSTSASAAGPSPASAAGPPSASAAESPPASAPGPAPGTTI